MASGPGAGTLCFRLLQPAGSVGPGRPAVPLASTAPRGHRGSCHGRGQAPRAAPQTLARSIGLSQSPASSARCDAEAGVGCLGLSHRLCLSPTWSPGCASCLPSPWFFLTSTVLCKLKMKGTVLQTLRTRRTQTPALGLQSPGHPHSDQLAANSGVPETPPSPVSH